MGRGVEWPLSGRSLQSARNSWLLMPNKTKAERERKRERARVYIARVAHMMGCICALLPEQPQNGVKASREL